MKLESQQRRSMEISIRVDTGIDFAAPAALSAALGSVVIAPEQIRINPRFVQAQSDEFTVKVYQWGPEEDPSTDPLDPRIVHVFIAVEDDGLIPGFSINGFTISLDRLEYLGAAFIRAAAAGRKGGVFVSDARGGIAGGTRRSSRTVKIA